jgi:hypothetical protein
MNILNKFKVKYNLNIWRYIDVKQQSRVFVEICRSAIQHDSH